MTKRISLFILTNFLILLTVSTVIKVFHLDERLNNYGVKHLGLIIFCLIWGFSGSFMSLWLSKIIAKRTMKLQMIDQKTYNPQLRDLLDAIEVLSQRAGIKKMPEVGIYESNEMNAFATGPTKNRSLIAISTGLYQQMDSDQILAVLAHEISHIANGDMVTMTLLQGLVNSFVLFLPRLISSSLLDDDRLGFKLVLRYLVIGILELVFGFLGSILVCYVSRRREYRADKGAALLCGSDKMIAALRGLLDQSSQVDNYVEKTGLKSLKIYGHQGKFFSKLFATHPSIISRIKKLKTIQ